MAVLLAPAVGLGVLAIRGQSQTNAGPETVYKGRVVPLAQLKRIADAYAVAVIDAVNKANTGTMIAEEARAGVVDANDVIRRNWQAYKETTLTAEEEYQAAQALSQGATEQAASLEETSASLEEIASMARASAESSTEASALMGDVARRVEGANSWHSGRRRLPAIRPR